MNDPGRPVVLDSSAVLAWLQREPGGTVVNPFVVQGASISAANWSEILQKAMRGGRPIEMVDRMLRPLIDVQPVIEQDATAAARLWRDHPSMSLADRLCLALAHRLSAQAVTADKAWRGISGVLIIR